MSNSIVKVTEVPVNDSLILVIGEDGIITPDKRTLEAYLSSQTGETELQIMQVNKSDGKNVDITVDTLTYLSNESEEGTYQSRDMNEIERNLMSFRMDHDYTPLTSPRPTEEAIGVDELVQTLSILEGSSNNSQQTDEVPQIKTQKLQAKQPKKIINLNAQLLNKAKLKTNAPNIIFKQPNKSIVKLRSVKQRVSQDEDENSSDEEFAVESEESEEDENISDYEMEEELPKNKPLKRKVQGTRSRKISESGSESLKFSKAAKINKVLVTKQNVQLKIDSEPIRTEKIVETPTDLKASEKKATPKKEKKAPKPIPDDFALFSTPDIIRRVGTNKDGTTPTTPTTPESPKIAKPAKIFQNSQLRTSGERSSSFDSKDKRHSTDSRTVTGTKDTIRQTQGRVGNLDTKPKDRRFSLDLKTAKHALNSKTLDVRKQQSGLSTKVTGHVGIEEPCVGNSEESVAENALEPVPSAEDIRAIIQNQDTKTFTTSLVIPDAIAQQSAETIDPSQINLENAALDLDQSILDNINSDMISEDILYQVAQSLVGNAELQNAIDKSLVDENLVLDTTVQQVLTENDENKSHIQALSNEEIAEINSSRTVQVQRHSGRVVVIPPIERPTTRSRNRKKDTELSKPAPQPVKVEHKEESVSSESEDSEDEKSDDDPDKLWCICNQPHNNRFMICCDTCEEWYHGKCVNVTKTMGQLMEQEGREWICLYCKDPALKRPAAAARRIRKASKNSSTELANEIKVEPEVLAEPTPPTVPGCLVCGKPCRTNSIYCSDPCILKHAKVVEKVVVFERSSGTIYSGNSAPSAANLDKWLQQHPGFEVVRSTNANRPVTTKQLAQSKLKLIKTPGNVGGVSLAVQRKGVNVGILGHASKDQPVQQKLLNKTHITGLKIVSKQVPAVPRTKLIQPAPIIRSPAQTIVVKPKLVQTTLKPATPVTTPVKEKEKPMPQKTPKARAAEEGPIPSNKQENIRENVKKTLLEQLTNRLNMVDDIKLTKEEVSKISTEIESQLYKCFGDTGQKYRNKYRSLIFNIKDIKNQTLWRRICERSINPYQLVRLSPDDLASQELALWRERENKHQLDMITKSELEQLGRNRQYVFKTHKGEQVLEDTRPTDSVDNTEVITNLGSDNNTSESSESKKDSKDTPKKSKHSKSDHDRHRSRSKSRKNREKSDRKDKKREKRSSSRDQSRHKRSRSKDSTRNSEKTRSRSKDRDRLRRTHKPSRHRRDSNTSTEKLDKKSKEILEQLVDNKIVPPLEDRLWKHVQQEDVTTAPGESDSDHEPTSTVTIPTPPRPTDIEEQLASSASSTEITQTKENEDKSSVDVSGTPPSIIDDYVSKSPPPKTDGHIWKGSINMVDVAQISITAHEVSGDCSGLGEDLPSCLDVVGRISPETVWDYIGKMKCSNSKSISLLRLNATNMEEKMPYIALYSYLSSRNRLGVIKSNNKAVKDFYILPLASQKPIPQALLPLNGPGFEESRPALLLGILVRDKRKRPFFSTTPTTSHKKIKVDVTTVPSNATSNRSYTPPPNPTRFKHVALPMLSQDSPKEDEDEDMDEPYSPEDSDPDTIPTPNEDSSKATNLKAADLSNLLSTSVKSTSFLDTGLDAHTFEPFNNKFNSIPGLDETTSLLGNDEELKRKMKELDERIARQKAEIDNMSQNIASSTTSGIGSSALASIALPSNLQQILDSLKSINPTTAPDTETTQTITNETIPLMLPKVSSRNLASSVSPPLPTSSTTSPTIPLNLPKPKSKLPASQPTASIDTKPNNGNKNITQREIENEKCGSVLSSLSEEELIRKAAEMLGESNSTSIMSNTKASNNSPGLPANSISGQLPSFSSGFVTFSPPPPTIVPPPVLSTISSNATQLDIIQPPIPGLDPEF